MAGQFEYIKDKIIEFFLDGIRRVQEINKKYSKPRITMTPTVKVSLLVLRIYLIVIMGLLLYKFITLVY